MHGKKDEALAAALDELAASAAVPSESDIAREDGTTKSQRPRAAPKKKPVRTAS